MNTCDTCLWWKLIIQDYGPLGSPNLRKWTCGECINPAVINGDCDGVDMLSPEADMPAINTARVHGDGYSDFLTGSKFGCIHHEPLNDNKDQQPPVA